MTLLLFGGSTDSSLLLDFLRPTSTSPLGLTLQIKPFIEPCFTEAAHDFLSPATGSATRFLRSSLLHPRSPAEGEEREGLRHDANQIQG
jgi:hypothetical protein